MLRRALVCFLTLLLASCFDIREEIWVEADGSGRLRFDYTVPTRAFQLAGGEDGIGPKIRKVFDEEPKLRLDELSFVAVGDDTRLTLQASTESLLSLMDLQESEAFHALPEASGDLAGTIDVKLRGLSVDVKRTIDFQKALGLATLAIDREQRETRRVTYILHLPQPTLEHNASRTEDEGRTLIWDHSLGEALDQPLVTSLRARIPLPWWSYVVIVLLPLLLGLAAFGLIRRLRRRAAA